MGIAETKGTVYHVYKGGSTVHWAGSLEQCRLAAEAQAAAIRTNSLVAKEASLFRFFKFEGDGERFMMAYVVTAEGKVKDHADVSIPAACW